MDFQTFGFVPQISKVRIQKLLNFDDKDPVLGRFIAVIDRNGQNLTVVFKNHLTDPDHKEIQFLLSIIAKNAPQKIKYLNEKLNKLFDPEKPKKVIKAHFDYEKSDMRDFSYTRIPPNSIDLCNSFYKNRKMPEELLVRS